MNYIKAKKLKMGQIFREERMVPVTLVELEAAPEEELKEGDKLKVSGTSKAKGFQGVVKRHGFHGGPKSHGQKKKHRSPGSIGSTGPQRVFPGTRMAGRMGGVTSTIRNLEVIAYDADRKILMLKGAVPGVKGRILKIYAK
ncbi:MAG: 50S ribosomal protein L3 [Candidatus Colwellbacteria bacterium]|nr:50S ribosomal protein L3 [Candidatus Colwellbacteria bacterium]